MVFALPRSLRAVARALFAAPLLLPVGASPAMAQGNLGIDLSTTSSITLVLVDSATQQLLPNTAISLALLPNAQDGGHQPGHTPQRNPLYLGTISSNNCNTGPSGYGCVVSFTSKELGGTVRFRMSFTAGGQSQQVDSENYVSIGANSGNDLPTLVGRAPTYDLVGSTSVHPDNHYCQEDVCVNLVRLADDYYAAHSLILAYNDSALVKGGLFDVKDNWLEPHQFHRMGRNQDVRANGGPNSIPFDSTIRQWFVNRVIAIFGTGPSHESIGTANEHYHIWA